MSLKQIWQNPTLSRAIQTFLDIRHRRALYLFIFLWFASIGLGFLVPEAVGKQILFEFSEKIAGLEQADTWSTFVFIFTNNLKATLVTICMGLIVFFPTLILMLNGAVVGVFLSLATRSLSLPILALLFPLLPHGILEIPAIILSAYLGTLLGWKLYRGNHFVPELSRKEFGKQVVIVYTIVIIPLIFVAALIESTVSSYLAMKLI